MKRSFKFYCERWKGRDGKREVPVSASFCSDWPSSAPSSLLSVSELWISLTSESTSCCAKAFNSEEVPKSNKSRKGLVVCSNLVEKYLFQQLNIVLHKKSCFKVGHRPKWSNKSNISFGRCVKWGDLMSWKLKYRGGKKKHIWQQWIPTQDVAHPRRNIYLVCNPLDVGSQHWIPTHWCDICYAANQS